MWHEGLVFKLAQNGISGSHLNNFEKVLINRKQGVVLIGFFSEYSKIAAGVPQSSILGPLLFLIYINDFEKHIKSNIKFFPDYTMFFSINTSANDLNHDLDIINRGYTKLSSMDLLLQEWKNKNI